ncbi:MAG: type II toxin-antitoxin system RelE/ParE family toxin [Candidatus Pacebacteria bacterium CG_4_10_14_0_8_um_filter_42_14]|nr:MAG: type II toxin-antitoxin system RelE/ParE family toxin [Candidatus Pacebacteria bacterium CG_4_10_14_0_8_um_filter_42_14]
MKKVVVLGSLAIKELASFSIEVRARFNDLFEILGSEGRLRMPFAKKIGDNLFEIRIKDGGQWRATYAYILKNQIVILSAFRKKTQKTPKNELVRALKRLRGY